MPSIEKKAKKQKQTASKFIYQEIYQDRRWKHNRIKRLKANPICMECEIKGITTPTTEIHHIIRFIDGLDDKEKYILAYDYRNTMSLCTQCHKLKHQQYKIDYQLREELINR